MSQDKLSSIALSLSPEKPIRSEEYLRGRTESLKEIERELRTFHGIPFIYGYRGVGKTSLARTAAQSVNTSRYEHIYVPCAPGATMLQVFREICENLIGVLSSLGHRGKIEKSLEISLSANPSVKANFKGTSLCLQSFADANQAVRTLHQLDGLFPREEKTIVVLDELEELNAEDRTDLAFLIKQIGDQDFRLKFILVGIAQNVHELIGAHESVPRYLKEVSLEPLLAQDLMEIVSSAAQRIEIEMAPKYLRRVAIVGNGFPHFAHLMGKAILIAAVDANIAAVTDEIYKLGVKRAVADSVQELRMKYEAATQRGEDYFKHLVWALAHSDTIDVRIDDWLRSYEELARKHLWERPDESKLRNAIGNLQKPHYGRIVGPTPARYGAASDASKRYRYKRFSNMLMRGHVRLQAENEGIALGNIASL